MNCQTKNRYSRQLEELLHPGVALATRLTKVGIICIFALSEQYIDPNSAMDKKTLALLRWHAINDIYSSKFGECGTYENQFQGVYREKSNTLKMINCKTKHVYLTGVLD